MDAIAEVTLKFEFNFLRNVPGYVSYCARWRPSRGVSCALRMPGIFCKAREHLP
jgi:hypothetical protein